MFQKRSCCLVQTRKNDLFFLFIWKHLSSLSLIVPHLVLSLSLVFLLLLKTALSGLHEFQCEYWVCLTICFFFFVCVLLTITFQTKYQTQGGKKLVFFSQGIKKVLDFGIVIKLLAFSHRIVLCAFVCLFCYWFFCESLKMASKLKSHFYDRHLWVCVCLG